MKGSTASKALGPAPSPKVDDEGRCVDEEDGSLAQEGAAACLVTADECRLVEAMAVVPPTAEARHRQVVRELAPQPIQQRPAPLPLAFSLHPEPRRNVLGGQGSRPEPGGTLFVKLVKGHRERKDAGGVCREA